MDRIINIKVGGNYLSKDNKNAGARGEANVTKLRITFDDGWADYNKKITFWDARGLNPVSIVLLPTLAENENTYIVPIPAEPMAEVGMFEFVIEGTVDDKVQRSFSDKLEVKESPSTEGAGQPVPPTEDELTQLSGAINKITSDILTVRNAKEETRSFANSAEASSNSAEDSAERAEENAETAKKAMNSAEESANKAHNALGKTPYIGVNGNWFAWDSETDAFYDTMIKAQSGSTVYVGENPPADADVWVHPDGGYADPTTIVNRLHYYGDINIAPSSDELFEFGGSYREEESEPFQYTVYSKGDAPLTGTIVVPYEYEGLPVIDVNLARGQFNKVILPKSIICILDFAFADCSELREITIPDSVTDLYEYAFNNCKSLQEIIIPKSLHYIGNGVFEGCENLGKITIPAGVTHIYEYAFGGCTSITDVYYQGTKEEWGKIIIDKGNECLLNAKIHYEEYETDDVPTKNSEKLITSGAVYEAIGDMDKALDNIIAKYGLGGDEK